MAGRIRGGFVKERVAAALSVRQDLYARLVVTAGAVADVAARVTACLRSGGKILICGNGGSAADAQHFAAEFTNRYRVERPPLAALALTTDTSALTAIGNDAGFAYIFSKQIEALGKSGDLLFVLTTSDVSPGVQGHSANLREALVVARRLGVTTVGLLSERSQAIRAFLDHALVVPHTETPLIQEAHTALLHLITELAEEALFPPRP